MTRYDDIIADLYLAGHTMEAISELVPKTPTQVRRALGRKGVPARWATEERVARYARIKQLHESGMTVAAISRDVGITPPSVAYVIRRGFQVCQQRGRVDLHPEIIALWKEGFPVREIVEKLKVSSNTVYHTLRLHGAYEKRPRSGVLKNG